MAGVLARAGWRGMAFADALRIECSAAWNIDIGLFASRHHKEQPDPALCVEWCNNADFMRWSVEQGNKLREPRSPRWIMQAWGTWRRQCQPAYWVQQVARWVRYQRSTGRPALVITDLRFPNEAAMVRGLAGNIIRVHRPDLAPLAADTATHESEMAARHIVADIALHNDGDLDHLANETWRVIAKLTTMAAAEAAS